MARVTVDDSLGTINNRFDLVLVASKRARDLSMGADEPKVAWNHDKPTVVALREIAAGKIDATILDSQPTIVNFDVKSKVNKTFIQDVDLDEQFKAEDSFEDDIVNEFSVYNRRTNKNSEFTEGDDIL